MATSIDKYQNYNAIDAYVYPAANRSDGGEDNSEKNLRTLTDKFTTKGFVIRRNLAPEAKEYFDITFNMLEPGSSDTMNIDRGECSVGGYYLNLKPITVNAGPLKLEVLTKYNILIMAVLDSSGLLSGDGHLVVGSSSDLISHGVRVQFLKDEEIPTLDSRYPYVKLGEVTTTADSRFNPETYVKDPGRYAFVDTSSIKTSSDRPLEYWIQELILKEVTKMASLNLYHTGDPETAVKPDESLKLVPILDEGGKVISYDVVIERETERDHTTEYPPKVSISDIEKRTRVTESDKYTANPPDLKTTSEGTWNGTSTQIARGDHLHDKRYVHLLDKSVAQEIKTPINFNKKVTTKAGLSGTGFNINDDGSAHFGGSDQKITMKTDGSMVTKGNFESKGTVTATKVFNAVWNDYAEFYLKDNPEKEVEPGTVISKIPGKLTYGPSDGDHPKLVVGVCSDSYGHILGGDEVSEEENLKKYIPVAVAGRVYVKIVKESRIQEGDLLVPSGVLGRATSARYLTEQLGTVIGKALESNDGTKDKILMQVMMM